MSELAKVALLYKAIVEAEMDCHKIFEVRGMSRYAGAGIQLMGRAIARVIANSDKLECMKYLGADTKSLEIMAKREIREILAAELTLIPSNDYMENNFIIYNVFGEIDSKEK